MDSYGFSIYRIIHLLLEVVLLCPFQFGSFYFCFLSNCAGWNFQYNTEKQVKVGILSQLRLLQQNKHLFLIVLGVWKSEIRVPAQSNSDENPLPGLQLALWSFLEGH